jgi:hypothetical protein
MLIPVERRRWALFQIIAKSSLHFTSCSHRVLPAAATILEKAILDRTDHDQKEYQERLNELHWKISPAKVAFQASDSASYYTQL